MPKHLTDNSSMEYTLFFDATQFNQLADGDGVWPDYQPCLDFIFGQGKLKFSNDQQMIQERNYKEIVSYILVKRGDKLLRFNRLPDKTNGKVLYLDGHYSVGFGGAVKESDQDIFSIGTGYSVYINSVKRLVRGKIGINIDAAGCRIQTMGILIDSSTTTNDRKIAIIHLIEIEESLSPVYLKTRQKPRFVDFPEISKSLEEFEFWSILCLQALYSDRIEIKTTIALNQNINLYDQSGILLIVGQIGSGKSEASRILRDEFGFLHISCSGLLKQLLGFRADEEIERKVLQDQGYDFISRPGGHERLAMAISDFMSTYPSDKYVVDGLRFPRTLSELRKVVNRPITLIYVQSHIKNRFRLYHENHKPSDGFSDFVRITNHPVEREIVKFRPDADIVIYNHGSLDSYTLSLREFFRSELTDEFLKDSWNLNASVRHEQLVNKLDISFWRVLLPKIQETIRAMDNSSTFRLLDVGCGTGVLSDALSKQVAQVVGIDPSDASIRKAEEEFGMSEELSFHCVPIEEFSEQCKTRFDCIVAHMSLQTAKRLDRALVSMNKLLKENGALIITIPHPAFNQIRKRKLFPKSKYNYLEAAFYKVPFTITKDRRPLPSLVPYFHRPIQEYAQVIHESGFVIQRILEPGPNQETADLYPIGAWIYPHFMMFVCCKTTAVS